MIAMEVAQIPTWLQELRDIRRNPPRLASYAIDANQ
jgi:hypothetical protein